MRKKILLSVFSVTIITFLLFIGFTTNTLAKDNTFDCGVGTTGKCAVRADRCKRGFETDNSVCSSITDLTKCLATTSISCVVGGAKFLDITCDSDSGIQTAIGCIHVFKSQENFIADVLKWAIGIGGGIAFLLIIYAGFMIMTASGVPERIKAGQELMTSAIAGIILLIFSIFILKLIGIDILGLGNWGFGT